MNIRYLMQACVVWFGAVCLVFAAVPSPSCAAGQRTFATPEKAVACLVNAVKSRHDRKLLAVFGPGSESLVSSGDRVADREDRKRFLKQYGAYHAIERQGPDRAVLVVGTEKYPFPFPLVKKGTQWAFDTASGRDEMLNRRIGDNELSAIQVVRTYLDAQREYAFRDGNADGIPDFATRFKSSPGKRDGLFWENKPGEPESPFGPLVARAALDGYDSEGDLLSPFHGYLFRILTAQGSGAEGGAYDYRANGRMLLGFALVAYPAQYGVSGIMTFMVNQAGTVYQKDLGQATADIAREMKEFSPDDSWKKLE